MENIVDFAQDKYKSSIYFVYLPFCQFLRLNFIRFVHLLHILVQLTHFSFFPRMLPRCGPYMNQADGSPLMFCAVSMTVAKRERLR